MRVGRTAAFAVGAVALAAAAIFWWAARPPQPGPTPRAAAQVVGRVEVAAGAATASWPTGAMVVVYAYALDGPRLPLAVLRRPAAALPMDFKLDDSLAPNPAFRLSQAAQLVVGARLGSGDASAAQPGDWLAEPQTVMTGAHGLRLVLQPPRPRAP